MTARHTIAAWGLGLLLLAAAGPAWAQPTLSTTLTPSTIGPGSTSSLQFTITNFSANGVTDLAFTVTLPAAMAVGTPAREATGCIDADLDAPPGGGTVTVSNGRLAALSSCTVDVDVTSTTTGLHTVPMVTLSSSAGSSMSLPIDLNVASNRPGFTLSASPATVAYGATTTLTYTIDNSANGAIADQLGFIHRFPPGIVVADPPNVSTDCDFFPVPGTVSATAGADVFERRSFDNPWMRAPAASSCTVSVDVTASNAGLHDLATAELQTNAGGGGFATTTLDVPPLERLHLSAFFRGDPVAAGDTVELDVTVYNRDRDDAATDITFELDFLTFMDDVVAPSLPAADLCGPGSMLEFVNVGQVELTGGSVAAGDSCTFTLAVRVQTGSPNGTYVHTSTAITGVIAGGPVTGNIASDSFTVATVPTVALDILETEVGAGSSFTMEFTLTNTSSTETLDNLAFTSELTRRLPFPVSVGLPATPDPPCGGGSSLALAFIDTDRQGLSLTGGSLAPDGSCTFSVSVDVPVGMSSGLYEFVTSELTGTDGVGTVRGAPSSDTVTFVEAPNLAHHFADPVVGPGATTTITYELTLGDGAPGDATDVEFSHDLNAALPGLVATGLPVTACGGTLTGSAGDSLLDFAGGTLTPGELCTFDVTVLIPSVATGGTYVSVPNPPTATVAGLAVTGQVADADLIVGGVTLAMAIAPSPTTPGATVTATFTLTNTSPTDGATVSFFTVNFAADLPGLAAVAPLPTEPCGAGSSVSGTTFFIFTNGTVPANDFCEFTVDLLVPAAATVGSYSVTSSSVSATVGAASVTTGPAVETLVVADPLLIEKSFSSARALPGATVSLSYTLYNTAATSATGLNFTDDYDAALSGLAAIGLPVTVTNCGATALADGSNVLSFTSGELAAGATCTFSVDLQLPTAIPFGTEIVSTSSALDGSVGTSGIGATATLGIDHVTFSHAFLNPTAHGATTTVTYTIDNAASATSVNGLRMLHDLDAVIAGAVATDLPQSDLCGPGSAVTGTTSVELNGGFVAAGSSCSFSVTVQIPDATVAGNYPSTTGELSQLGAQVAGTSTATATVIPPAPGITPSFAPTQVSEGEVAVLTLTVDNTLGNGPVTGLTWDDTLPAGLDALFPGNATTDCTGGTFLAVGGGPDLSLSGGSVDANTSCSMSIDVTAFTGGSFTLSPADLFSSSGAGTATGDATLFVVPPLPDVSVSFSPETIFTDDPSTLEIVVDNRGGNSPLNGINFSELLPAGLVPATPDNAETSCLGGTVNVDVNGDDVTFQMAAGTANANSVCAVAIDVTSATAGSYTFAPVELQTGAGTVTLTTSATLTVNARPGGSSGGGGGGSPDGGCGCRGTQSGAGWLALLALLPAARRRRRRNRRA